MKSDWTDQDTAQASMQPLLYKLHIDRLLCLPQYRQIMGLGAFTAEQTKVRVKRGVIARDGYADLFDSMMSMTGPKGGGVYGRKDMWLDAYLMVGVGKYPFSTRSYKKPALAILTVVTY